MSNNKAVYQSLFSFCGCRVMSIASSAMDRDSKLRRLHYLRKKLPHMSASALAGVLEEVQKHGAVDLHQRKHIREATHQELSKYDEYGPIFCEVVLEGEQPCKATIVNLHALLFAITSSP